VSVRRSTGRGKKKHSRSSAKHRRSSYIQSSDYLIGEHGNYIEIRDKYGSHVHINKNIPEMFVMSDDDDIDWDLLVDGRPAIYVDYDDHDAMYQQLVQLKSDDDDWVDTIDTVWRNNFG